MLVSLGENHGKLVSLSKDGVTALQIVVFV